MLSLLLLIASVTRAAEQEVVILLKNGDRLTGKVEGDAVNSIVLVHRTLGRVVIPTEQIASREPAKIPSLPTGVAGVPGEQTQPPRPQIPPGPFATTDRPSTVAESATNSPPKVASTPAVTNAPASTPPKAMPPGTTLVEKKKEEKPKGPKLWNSELQFGLNLRYSQRDQQEILVLAKSTYNKAPWRHIFDYTFSYGKTEGLVTGNRMSGSEKTEYDLTKKVYLFNLAGAGYDRVRKIDMQYEINPGVGFQLINSTNWNFVMKGEIGGGFQRQYRATGEDEIYYSARIADIFSWKVPKTKIVADGKVEVFPSINDFGEYRLRLEGTLRYPLSDKISFNMIFIDIYDTQAAQGIDRNDMQIRSTLGVRF